MQEKPITKKIIYQADDDQDDRMLFLDAVLDLNLPVAVLQAADGQELLDALLKSKCLPEFIFLDINMPCKDGFHCLTEIRNAEGDLKNVNIIMLPPAAVLQTLNFPMNWAQTFMLLNQALSKV